jgi:Domain of unknown function (DUF4157)
MNKALAQTQPDFTPAPRLLQRKCSCGNHTAAGGECAECAGKKNKLQRKLRIGAVNDPLEHEADRVADQVMRRTPHGTAVHAPLSIQRMGNLGGGFEGEVPDSVTRTLSGSGRALDAGLRGDMEARFGRDFSNVRVHQGGLAERSAREVNARAYTVGSDVVFGAGEYAPGSQEGQRLLAHELAHVVQQEAFGAPIVSRKGIESYETRATPFTGADIANTSIGSYWEQIILGDYALAYSQTVNARFASNAEERDAVLSALWNVRPATLTTQTTKLVNLPARAGSPNFKPLVYKFEFRPKSTQEKKDNISIEFVAEDTAAVTAKTQPPPNDFKPTDPPPLTYSGFPNDDIKAYWAKHQGEQKHVFNWIENVAPDQFEKILTTDANSPANIKAPQRLTSFHVKGNKKAGEISDLTINFLGAAGVTSEEPPKGYHDKDRLDLYVEQSQTRPHAKKKDTLGVLSGIDPLPAAEKLPVKYAIWQYFETGTRNAEVDVIVPILTSGRRVFYTLRFGDKNNVDIERVSEEGASKGMKSQSEFDLSRVNGFADNSADLKKLSAWLKKRYPSVSATGTTVEEMRKSASDGLKAGSAKPEWFLNNYRLTVLAEVDGKSWLKQKHLIPANVTTDVKDFTPLDLNMLEFALQTMADPMLNLINGVRLIRQTEGYSKLPGKNDYVRKEDLAGLEQDNGNDKSVTIFDRANLSDPNLFVGGKNGVRQSSTMTAVHEFGHIVENKNGIKSAFSAFVAKNKIKPITWYAAAKPASDFFTEAFSLFHADPEWMKSNIPMMHAWFETLSQSGKPPPLN